jgi:Ulp1 family protease
MGLGLPEKPSPEPPDIGQADLGFGLSNMLGESLSNTLGESLSNNLGESLSNNLGESLSNNLGESLSNNLGESLSKNVGANLSKQVNENMDVEALGHEDVGNDETVFRGNADENPLMIRISTLNLEDLECLKATTSPGRWLNDNVIMNYMILEYPKIDESVLIVDRDVWVQGFPFPDDPLRLIYPRSHENWTFVIFPIFINANHWTLAVVSRDGTCEHYDSMGGDLTEQRKNLIKRVMSFLTEDEIRQVMRSGE